MVQISITGIKILLLLDESSHHLLSFIILVCSVVVSPSPEFQCCLIWEPLRAGILRTEVLTTIPTRRTTLKLGAGGRAMNKLQSLETFAPFVSLLGVVRTIVQHLSGFVFFPPLSRFIICQFAFRFSRRGRRKIATRGSQNDT